MNITSFSVDSLPKAPSFKLDGKRALVTGAGRGIGLALASALAESGAEVSLAARSRPELEVAVEAIRDRGGRAEALALDVTIGLAVETRFAFVAAMTFSSITLVQTGPGDLLT